MCKRIYIYIYVCNIYMNSIYIYAYINKYIQIYKYKNINI